MLKSEIEAIFDECVVEEFQIETLKLLIDVYGRSKDEVQSRYEFPETKYLWGHERRAMFDRDWRLLAEKYEDQGITASIESNAPENFHFTRIKAGRVIITAACAFDRLDIVKRAEFRETYARTSQMSLFGGDGPTEDAPLYAILLHSPGSMKTQPFPRFADFAFPEPEQKGYVHRLRLFDRYFAVIDGAKVGEDVADDLQPKLRTDIEGDVKKKGSA